MGGGAIARNFYLLTKGIRAPLAHLPSGIGVFASTVLLYFSASQRQGKTPEQTIYQKIERQSTTTIGAGGMHTRTTQTSNTTNTLDASNTNTASSSDASTSAPAPNTVPNTEHPSTTYGGLLGRHTSQYDTPLEVHHKIQRETQEHNLDNLGRMIDAKKAMSKAEHEMHLEAVDREKSTQFLDYIHNHFPEKYGEYSYNYS